MRVELISASAYFGVLFGSRDLSLEQLFVAIARVSSDRELSARADDIEGLIRYCAKNGHWSVFEMVDVCLYIETSLPIAMQLLRHKSFSFQMFSQRYQNVFGVEDFVFRHKCSSARQASFEPAALSKELQERVDSYLKEGLELYKELKDEHNVSLETARFVLPLCSKTELFMKGSLRSWIHYLLQRCSKHAQKEHMEIAYKIKEKISSLFPITFRALESFNYFKNE